MKFKITVDCLVFGYDPEKGELKILLVKRNNDPGKGSWALPGGFVKRQEDFLDYAKRKLTDETGINNIYLEQLNAYGLTDISPGNRIVSVACFALVKYKEYSPAKSETHMSKWVHFKKIPRLPFDHLQKAKDAISKIKELTGIRPLVFNLLPDKFTLNQLLKFYEELYDKKFDNRNFRRKIKKLPYVKLSHEIEKNVSHRPGELYFFNNKEFTEYINNGF